MSKETRILIGDAILKYGHLIPEAETVISFDSFVNRIMYACPDLDADREAFELCAALQSEYGAIWKDSRGRLHWSYNPGMKLICDLPSDITYKP